MSEEQTYAAVNRRRRIYAFSGEMVAALLAGDVAEIRPPIPEGARLLSVYWSFARHAFLMVLAHRSWDELPENAAAEVVSATFARPTSDVRRLELPDTLKNAGVIGD